ncbi:hypothetical protein MAPG_02984 [Magnaporthiopsis poae ATCC 64411]|uniref:DNA2/NAM7 helicase-like C-terminal domain-containing protein n=1 Tax=Magnaporthiopsis poae (strain ATCC 64411 / 73-15) TaxID=644358 RepID=A0A0C4DSU3_MAGP6|nr:hypothetical protein MAPG_02984 [Magnaporthiopsis poae ATCC 64411]
MSHQGVEVPAEGNGSEAVKMDACKIKPKQVALMTANFEKVVCCRAGPIANITKVQADMVWAGGRTDDSPAFGIRLRFPRGSALANEDQGFGHVENVLMRPTGLGDEWRIDVEESEHYEVIIWLPLADIQIDSRPARSTTVELFGCSTALHEIRISITNNANPVIHGAGKPFRNADDEEVDSWINGGQPIAHGVTFADILSSRAFFLVAAMQGVPTAEYFSCARLPPPFEYGYGTQQYWDVDRYLEQMRTLRGHRFQPSFGHASDNDHVTVLTQADVLWVDVKAKEIEKLRMRVYSVPVVQQERAWAFYVVLTLPPLFEELYMPALRRLTSNDSPLFLSFFEEKNSEKATAVWQATLVQNPERFPQLKDHLIVEGELVLFARRPRETKGSRYTGADFEPKVFASKNPLLEAERMVTAACRLLPGAPPSPPLRVGECPDLAAQSQALHRALARGTGFIDQPAVDAADLVSATEAMSLDGPGRVSPLPLPAVDLTSGIDPRYLEAIVAEVVPEDRDRFLAHVSKRPLGLTMVKSAPGMGKTSVLSAISLCMNEAFGKLFGSGPSHAAVSNFAGRYYKLSCRVIDRHNKGLAADDPTRRKYKLVVRGYNFHDEALALQELLSGDKPKERGHWDLSLTPAFWLLRSLQSDLVSSPSADESAALDTIRRKIVSSTPGMRLADFVSGKLAPEQYQADAPERKVLSRWLGLVVEEADALFTTPAKVKCSAKEGSSKGWNEDTVYSDWWEKEMRCVALDEAGATHLPNLYQVWGNRLLPCAMAGDTKQLKPAVMTYKEEVTEESGEYLNRFAFNGEISALAFLSGTGMPTWRQRRQFRMAEGMFELSKTLFYPGLPAKNDEGCAISDPRHRIGVLFEAFMKRKFPTLKDSPSGQLLPVFLDVRGSRVYVDQTKSKSCPDQVKAALGILSEFALAVGAEMPDVAKRMAILAPYKANVELIGTRMRKMGNSGLEDMPPSSTIDSIQGQEAELVAIVFGTSQLSGPGFTTDPNRLNVSLTRQMSALLLVGDITAAGPLEGDKGKGKGKGKGKPKKPANEAIVTIGPNGEVLYVKPGPIRQMSQFLADRGRVVSVDSESKLRKMAGDDGRKPKEEAAAKPKKPEPEKPKPKKPEAKEKKGEKKEKK